MQNTWPRMSSEYLLEQACEYNFNDLIAATVNFRSIGIASCRTPIKQARLDGMLTYFSDKGCDPSYRVVVDPDGIEMVYVIWNVAAPKIPYAETKAGWVGTEGVIYHEHDVDEPDNNWL